MASILSSIINLAKTIVAGSSLLVLPHFFIQTGVLLGVVMYLICAFVHGFGMHLVALCALKARARGEDASFNSLAQAAFGGKAAGILAATTVCVTCYGTCAALLIVMGDLLPEISQYLGAETSPWNSRSFWITCIGWCFDLPLCFLLDLDSLKYSSVIGNGAIIFFAMMLGIFASGAIPLPPLEQEMTLWPPPESSYTSMSGMMQSVSIFMFSLVTTSSIPTMVLELENATIGRIDFIIIATNVIVTALYIIDGCLGGWAFGAAVNGNAMKSFPNAQGTTAGSLSFCARCAFIVTVATSFPLWMHVGRGAVSQALLGKSPGELRFSVRAAVSFALFIFTWGIAMAVTNLDKVLAFTGATSQTLNGCILPALFYLLVYLGGVKSNGEDNTGITLQSLGSADGDVEARSWPSQNRGTLKKPAMVMAIAGVVLIPVMLCTEAWKMLNED